MAGIPGPPGVPLFKKIKHLIEYALIRLLDGVLSVLPRGAAIRLGGVLGRTAGFFFASRRRLILENLEKSFPEMSVQKKKELNASVWRNLGMTAVEFSRLPDIRSDNYTGYFDYQGAEAVERAAQENKGIIFVAFHFSNWEMAGIAHQFRFRNLVAIARPMKNPWVENYVQGKRRACGMDIILHRNAVRVSLKVLKQKKSIAILVDQNIRTGGVFVDFLGRPAATTTLPALLHIRTGAPVFLAYTVRENGKYKMIYSPPIQFPDVADPDRKIQAYTQILSDQISDVVRRQPENWFWVHNRWKRSAGENSDRGAG